MFFRITKKLRQFRWKYIGNQSFLIYCNCMKVINKLIHVVFKFFPQLRLVCGNMMHKKITTVVLNVRDYPLRTMEQIGPVVGNTFIPIQYI